MERNVKYVNKLSKGKSLNRFKRALLIASVVGAALLTFWSAENGNLLLSYGCIVFMIIVAAAIR